MSGPEQKDDPAAAQARVNAVLRHMMEEKAPGAAPDPEKKDDDASVEKPLARWGTVGVVVVFLLGKFKWVLAGLKFLKVGSLASMFLMVWVYAQMWGWLYALGFVLLIFVHEMGHALFMKQQGLPFGAPVFIPFVGAVIAMKKMPKNAWMEAVVGIGGPFIGTLGAAVCLGIGFLTGGSIWFALASTGFLINLFNMIPVSPLDGGRIVGVISRWFWAVGYAVGIAVLLVTSSPILFLILLLGVFSLPRLIRHPVEGYYDVPNHQRITMGASYFGLMAMMAGGMWLADAQVSHLVDPEAVGMSAAGLYTLWRGAQVEGASG